MWLDLGEYRGPSRFHAVVMFMVQRTRRRNEEYAYRCYVTDSLQNAPQGKYLQRSWSDMLTPYEEIDAKATIDYIVGRIEADDEPS